MAMTPEEKKAKDRERKQYKRSEGKEKSQQFTATSNRRYEYRSFYTLEQNLMTEFAYEAVNRGIKLEVGLKAALKLASQRDFNWSEGTTRYFFAQQYNWFLNQRMIGSRDHFDTLFAEAEGE